MIRAYRVWDNQEKTYSDKAFSIDQFGLCYVQDEDDYWEEINDSRFIVEFETGLTDKNAGRVYEGDIFRNTINGGTWRVYWNEKDAAFWIDSGVAGCSLGEFDWDRSDRKYGFIRKNCEVIGNVHENKELLGDEEL